jgi:hypothetical protein
MSKCHQIEREARETGIIVAKAENYRPFSSGVSNDQGEYHTGAESNEAGTLSFRKGAIEAR